MYKVKPKGTILCKACGEPKAHHAPDCTLKPPSGNQGTQVGAVYRDMVEVLDQHIRRHRTKIRLRTEWNAQDAKDAALLTRQVTSVGNLWLKIQKAEQESLNSMSVDDKLQHMKAFILSMAHTEKQEAFITDLVNAMGWELAPTSK